MAQNIRRFLKSILGSDMPEIEKEFCIRCLDVSGYAEEDEWCSAHPYLEKGIIAGVAIEHTCEIDGVTLSCVKEIIKL